MPLKYLYILVTGVILLAVSCEHPSMPVDTPQTVKTQTKWLADIHDFSKQKKIFTKEFDITRNLISETYYSDRGIINHESRYTYVSDSSSEIKFIYDETGEIDKTEYFTYKFDVNGKIDRKFEFDNGWNITKTIDYTYDELGNLAKAEEFENNGHLTNSTSYNYNYNNNGLLVERKVINSNGSMQRRDSLVYKSGQAISRIIFDSDNRIKNVHEFKYGRYQRIISEKVTDANGEIIQRYIFEYSYY
ncbi:MAG: hypothetical protein ACOC2K_04270 [Bacteroidota bacterium]